MTRHRDDRTPEQLQQLVLGALHKRQDGRRTGDPPKVIRALVLARLFGINPHARTEDSRKRAVRKIIHDLRQAGEPICSNDRGYWLASEASDWAEYNTWRQRQGLAHLAAVSQARRSSAAAETAGQMSLLDTRPSSAATAIGH